MNERIRELAEQAGGFPLYPDHPEGDVTMAFRERALERLVDMVVQECANACLTEANKWRGEQDVADFKLCASVIKEHFGVKE